MLVPARSETSSGSFAVGVHRDGTKRRYGIDSPVPGNS
jgi:hypothetical protein